MPKKKSLQRSAWQRMPKSIYGVIAGALAGSLAVATNTGFAVSLLIGLTIAASYVFFVSYQKAVSSRWSPRRVLSPSAIMGALAVGVMSVAGAQYLGSSSASIFPGHKGTVSNGNIGSIINAQGCENLGSTAKGNIGSIVRIDGGGTCDINDILGSVGNGNIGSIIIVDNACGDVKSAIANRNIGSIVKVTSVGPCQRDLPTTVVVQPNTPAPTPAPVAIEKPIELPQTGPGNVTMIALIAGLSGYLVSAVWRLTHHTPRK